LVLVAALVLAVGVATHGLGDPAMPFMPAMAHADDMHASNLAADPSNSDEMPGGCHGCVGDEKGTAAVACSAFCAAVAELALARVDLFAHLVGALVPKEDRALMGLFDPPDPYPPRPANRG
jgi:hypothetical protein